MPIWEIFYLFFLFISPIFLSILTNELLFPIYPVLLSIFCSNIPIIRVQILGPYLYSSCRIHLFLIAAKIFIQDSEIYVVPHFFMLNNQYISMAYYDLFIFGL